MGNGRKKKSKKEESKKEESMFPEKEPTPKKKKRKKSKKKSNRSQPASTHQIPELEDLSDSGDEANLGRFFALAGGDGSEAPGSDGSGEVSDSEAEVEAKTGAEFKAAKQACIKAIDGVIEKFSDSLQQLKEIKLGSEFDELQNIASPWMDEWGVFKEQPAWSQEHINEIQERIDNIGKFNITTKAQQVVKLQLLKLFEVIKGLADASTIEQFTEISTQLEHETLGDLASAIKTALCSAANEVSQKAKVKVGEVSEKLRAIYQDACGATNQLYAVLFADQPKSIPEGEVTPENAAANCRQAIDALQTELSSESKESAEQSVHKNECIQKVIELFEAVEVAGEKAKSANDLYLKIKDPLKADAELYDLVQREQTSPEGLSLLTTAVDAFETQKVKFDGIKGQFIEMFSTKSAEIKAQEEAKAKEKIQSRLADCHYMARYGVYLAEEGLSALEEGLSALGDLVTQKIDFSKARDEAAKIGVLDRVVKELQNVHDGDQLKDADTKEISEVIQSEAITLENHLKKGQRDMIGKVLEMLESAKASFQQLQTAKAAQEGEEDLAMQLKAVTDASKAIENQIEKGRRALVEGLPTEITQAKSQITQEYGDEAITTQQLRVDFLEAQVQSKQERVEELEKCESSLEVSVQVEYAKEDLNRNKKLLERYRAELARKQEITDKAKTTFERLNATSKVVAGKAKTPAFESWVISQRKTDAEAAVEKAKKAVSDAEAQKNDAQTTFNETFKKVSEVSKKVGITAEDVKAEEESKVVDEVSQTTEALEKLFKTPIERLKTYYELFKKLQGGSQEIPDQNSFDNCELELGTQITDIEKALATQRQASQMSVDTFQSYDADSASSEQQKAWKTALQECLDATEFAIRIQDRLDQYMAVYEALKVAIPLANDLLHKHAAFNNARAEQGKLESTQRREAARAEAEKRKEVSKLDGVASTLSVRQPTSEPTVSSTDLSQASAQPRSMSRGTLRASRF